ncbi:unnamed protein product [Ciceribacter selenitireducens ATCC BAA-1503]|uniref:Uncharacterized protein n=1 Tax=Ciceribacter selenitireducens ATCC BAA-1503 TaxID=1336235 RepID=A0A376AJP5_9HYPH|nr:unnamed protein product [Ciceribacter selenitireducens ATCC BAA-1503]
MQGWAEGNRFLRRGRQCRGAWPFSSSARARGAPPHPASASLGGPLPAGARRPETSRRHPLLPGGEKVARRAG